MKPVIGVNTNPDAIDVQQGLHVGVMHREKETASKIEQTEAKQMGLSDFHLQLSTIESILRDQVKQIETALDKKKGIQAALSGVPIAGQENIEPRSYEDPHKKVAQIAQIIEDEHLHIHEQFTAIESILSGYKNCDNPWIQAHQALVDIERSSRQSINREEERRNHLRQLWTFGMKEKADFFPKMAKDQKWWQQMGAIGMVAAVSFPLLGTGLSQPLANLSHPLLSRIMEIDLNHLTAQLKTFSNRAPNLLNAGSQLIQMGSSTSMLFNKDKETLHEWATQQERQNLDTQQQVVQDTRQNDHSLRDRHLEVIRTLSQIVGR